MEQDLSMDFSASDTWMMDIGAEVVVPLEVTEKEENVSALNNGKIKFVPEDALITPMDLNSKFVFYLDFSCEMSGGLWYAHLIICGDAKFYLLRKKIGNRVYWGLSLAKEMVTNSPTYNAELEFELSTGQRIIMYQEKIQILDLNKLVSPTTESGELEKFLSFVSSTDESQATIRIGMDKEIIIPRSEKFDWEVNDELDDEFFLSSDIESEIEDNSSSGYDTSEEEDNSQDKEDGMLLELDY